MTIFDIVDTILPERISGIVTSADAGVPSGITMSRTRSALLRLAVVACSLGTVCVALPIDMPKLRAAYQRAQASAPQERFADWQSMLGSARGRGASELLSRVNSFFNRQIRFVDDIDLWGQSDYWATPMETLARGAGDCEDFAIAKYYTLIAMGIPVEQLRLTYVRARLSAPGGPAFQAHMVLAYYPSPSAEPLVLDNLVDAIAPASKRPDLLPVFNFNGQGIYQAGATGAATSAVGNLSRWADAMQRIRAEGFD
jgi:predicted transglutaminase-like cysteine proteinase